MDAARTASTARRARASDAERAYDAFLTSIAVPVFRQLANVLRAEGLPFETQTPSNGARLVSDRNRDDVISLELDASLDPPQPVLVCTRTRGSRLLRTEGLVTNNRDIGAISEDDLIERVIEELRPWLE